MTGLVEILCRGLGVKFAPEDMVEVRREQDVTVTLSLSPDDLNRVDGRDHRSAKAIRQVLSAAATAQQARFHLVARVKE